MSHQPSTRASSTGNTASSGIRDFLPFPFVRHFKNFKVLLRRSVIREDVINILLEALLAAVVALHLPLLLHFPRLALLHLRERRLVPMILLHAEPVLQEHRALLTLLLILKAPGPAL